MADQAPSGTVEEAEGQASLARSAGPHPNFHGRPTSWVTTSVIIVGFTVGGIALCVGPAWWLFWTGVAIVVLGGLFGAATRIFDDWY